MVRCNPSLVRALLAVLHEVYWSSAGPAVRSQALKAILRCVYYADAPLLRQVLKMQVTTSLNNILFLFAYLYQFDFSRTNVTLYDIKFVYDR